MKIKLQCHIVDFDYLAPIIVQKNSMSCNRHLSVTLYKDEINNGSLIGTLDLTALAHFHHYQLEQWRFILQSFFTAHEIQTSAIDLKRPYFNMISLPPLYTGELLFIIESVLFMFIEKNIPEVLDFITKKPIEINCLYSPDLPLLDLPFWLKLKIKPTSSSLESTIALVNEIKSQKEHVLFRLDGNAQFELSQLYSFLDALEKNCGPLSSFIEYIEEPLKNFNDYILLNHRAILPVAFDESLLFFQDSLPLLNKNCFIVLKPSLIGISKAFSLALQRPQKMIISSCYETASAIRPLLYLAALNPSTAHGLDTLKFLPNHLSIKMNHFSLPF